MRQNGRGLTDQMCPDVQRLIMKREEASQSLAERVVYSVVSFNVPAFKESQGWQPSYNQLAEPAIGKAGVDRAVST